MARKVFGSKKYCEFIHTDGKEKVEVVTVNGNTYMFMSDEKFKAIKSWELLYEVE